MTLSPAQRSALRVTANYGDGTGWAEVERAFIDDRTGARFPLRLEAALCVRVFGALERKGLIVRAPDGPQLTEAGRIYLEGMTP